MGALLGPAVGTFLLLFFAVIIFLYVFSIVWTFRDANERGIGDKWYKFLSIVPFAGIIAYITLRPPLLLIDKKEQEVDIALKSRQLEYYGNCSNCGAQVREDFLICPNCQQKLKDACKKCGNALELDWFACPYCGTAKESKKTFRDSESIEYESSKIEVDDKKDN